MTNPNASNGESNSSRQSKPRKNSPRLSLSKVLELPKTIFELGEGDSV